jgi:hypothetical protein
MKRLGIISILFLTLVITQVVHLQAENYSLPIQSSFISQNQIYLESIQTIGPKKVVYSETFTNGIPPGWTTTGTANGIANSNAVWVYRGPSTSPSNATGSRGAFSGNFSVIQSPTVANGFVIFDSDYLDNNGINNNFCGTGVLACAPHYSTLTTSTFNLHQHSNVELRFFQYYRRFQGPGGVSNLPATYVDISTNDGVTWSNTITINSDVWLNATTTSSSFKSLDISQFVDNQSNVKIRFRFDGAYYFWQVDDLEIVATPKFQLTKEPIVSTNKVDGKSCAFKFSFSNECNGVVSLRQVSPLKLNGNVKNTGSSVLTNLKLQVKIFRDNQIDTILFSSTQASLLAGTTANFNINSGYTPVDTGTYKLQYTVISDSALTKLDSLWFQVTKNQLGSHFNVNSNSIGTSYNAAPWGSISGVSQVFNLSPDTLVGIRIPLLVCTANSSINIQIGSNTSFTQSITATDVSNGFIFVPFSNHYPVNGITEIKLILNGTVNLKNDATVSMESGRRQMFVAVGGPFTGYSNSDVFNRIHFNLITKSSYIPPIAYAIDTLVVCAGDTVDLFGSPGYSTYLWSNGASTPNLAVTTSGTYFLVVTSPNGTTDTSDFFIVTVNQLPLTPSIIASGITTFCTGGSVVLTSSSATGNTWSNGATTQSITVSQSGSYSVTVSNGNCTASSATTVVTVNPLPSTPTVTAGGSTTFCAGGSVVLTSSSATGNTWSNGATTQSITVSQSGSYSVTVSNGNCTASSAPTVVTVNPLPATPMVTAGGSTTFCAGGSVVLTSSSATGNTWSNGATTQSITVSQSGSYSVTVSNGNCTASSAPTVVTVNPLPPLYGGPDVSVCAGQSVTLTAIGSAPPFIWSGGIQNGVPFVPATTNTYTVSIINSYGCINSDQVLVTVNPLPAVNAGADISVCLGTPVTLSATGASSYSWNNGVVNGVPFTPTTTITYTVTGTGANGCSNTDQVVVTVNPLPTVNAGADIAVCSGTPVTLSATGASTYAWTNGIVNGVAFTPSASNSYIVTGTDGNGCINSDSVTVTVLPLGTVSLPSNIEYCIGSGHLRLPHSQGNPYFSGVAVYNNGTTFYTEVPGQYTINYLFTNINGCTQTGTLTITARPQPIKPIIQQISATKLKTAQSAATYQWYRNDVPIPGANSNELQLTTGGKYSVVTYNAFGCGSMSEGYVIGPNGLGTEENNLQLLTFSNPTTTTTTFQLIGNHSDKIVVVIHSVLGELIYQEVIETPTGTFTLDFTPYPASTYNVSILDLSGNFQFDERIVKMN